jgi:hypothetical protein
MVLNYKIMYPGTDEDLDKGFEWAVTNLRGIYGSDTLRFATKLLDWSKENQLSITVEGVNVIRERVTEAVRGKIEAEKSIELHTWQDIESLKFPDNP